MVVQLTCGGTYRRRVLWGAVIAIVGNLMLGILLLIGVRGAFLWVLGVIVVDGLVIWVLLQHSEQMEDIFQGVRKLREGNLEHRISIPENGMLRELAEDINGVADGMKISVSKEIKAERMKTELITNVSHDLKTPLTSIVNYIQLLSQEELSPPEANDYVKVIRQKSEKLKNLTQDLFDISKAQSGSIDVQIEQLDLAVLVKQALGEAEEGLEKAGLSCRVKVNGSTEILGDGKLLARVAENLIGNIVKYALPNTRVYIEMEEQKDMVIAQFKNIAGYEMNFSGEEITQRFVRGDSARTTDGNGLGLAIAQSYAAACGGELEVVVDGDLFKAILMLGRAA